ncbi:MAG: phage Gp37/Gp68 family protein [Dehalococcoidia bacterium]|nr:phage Gp37/Gp68 family protein [Dehalococcoidia bacterium]
MGLNKQVGNMYGFVTHTWNPIRGECPHDCAYCYMKVYKQPELHFAEEEMRTKLGHHNFIFVGSSTDMWAEAVPDLWIAKVLNYCRNNDTYNKYLFQSKNPARFYGQIFPDDTILATTIETNRPYEISKAPTVEARKEAMCQLFSPKMVSIEPIMDFDLDVMVEMIKFIQPEFVSIGADSKGHNLPEPSPEKTQELIKALQGIAIVKIKENLNRIMCVPAPDKR